MSWAISGYFICIQIDHSDCAENQRWLVKAWREVMTNDYDTHPVCDILDEDIIASSNQCYVHFTLRFIESSSCVCVRVCVRVRMLVFTPFIVFVTTSHTRHGVVWFFALKPLLHAWLFCWLRACTPYAPSHVCVCVCVFAFLLCSFHFVLLFFKPLLYSHPLIFFLLFTSFRLFSLAHTLWLSCGCIRIKG